MPLNRNYLLKFDKISLTLPQPTLHQREHLQHGLVNCTAGTVIEVLDVTLKVRENERFFNRYEVKSILYIDVMIEHQGFRYKRMISELFIISNKTSDFSK